MFNWLMRRLGYLDRFGDAIIVTFFIVQALDGAFTYWGVRLWGINIEANPVARSVISSLGLGAGLVVSKLLATILGTVLHMGGAHRLVAFLTLTYLAVAILPWSYILLTY